MSKKTKERRQTRQKEQKRKNIIIATGLLVAVIGFGALLFLTSGNTSQTVSFPDIHGISFTGDGDQLRVATHTGLVSYSNGSWSRPDLPINDYMGYSGTSDGFYSSGHPGAGSNLVNPIGLVKSDDFGASVQTINFLGETDFHVMGTSYFEDTVYVLNPAPNSLLSAGLHYSLDGGETWTAAQANGISSQPIQLAVHPSDSSIVAFATQSGLYISEDFGDSFDLIDDENVATAVRFDPDGKRIIYGYQWLYEYNLETEEITPFSSVPDIQTDQAILYTDINPKRDEIAIATSNRDIFISQNNGDSWIQIGEDGISVTP